MSNLIVNDENIQNKIYTIRGLQVMLDEELARLYQVETKTFNKQLKEILRDFQNILDFS